MLSGVLLLVVVPPLALFIRNSPESMGLRLEGDSPEEPLRPSDSVANQAPAPLREREDFTVREAMGTWAFWQLAVSMGCRLFPKTALTVHMVPLMVWRGVDEQTATLLVGFFAFVQIILRPIGG